jgi:hypothetical protein
VFSIKLMACNRTPRSNGFDFITDCKREWSIDFRRIAEGLEPLNEGGTKWRAIEIFRVPIGMLSKERWRMNSISTRDLWETRRRNRSERLWDRFADRPSARGWP